MIFYKFNFSKIFLVLPQDSSALFQCRILSGIPTPTIGKFIKIRIIKDKLVIFCI